MNSICLVGRLTGRPDIKAFESGTNISNFTIAVDRIKRGEVDFFHCTAFGRTAEALFKYCDKGQLIGIQGMLRDRVYTDRDGNRKEVYEIIVSHFTFCGGGRKEEKETDGIDDDFFLLEDDPF